jgi:hypothetical protein
LKNTLVWRPAQFPHAIDHCGQQRTSEKATASWEAVIKAAESGKDVGAVQYNLTQIAKSISHAFQATTIFRDGEITLNKCAELSIKDRSAGFTIPDELIL